MLTFNMTNKNWQILSRTVGTTEYLQQRNRESDIYAIRLGQYKADLKDYLNVKLNGSTNAVKIKTETEKFQANYSTWYGVDALNTTTITTINTTDATQNNVVAGRITGVLGAITSAIKKFF